jgi:hypothetical protein
MTHEDALVIIGVLREIRDNSNALLLIIACVVILNSLKEMLGK